MRLGIFINHPTVKAVMAYYGKRGGKRSLQTMTAEQRRARASKAGKASAQAKRKRGRGA